MMPKFNPILPYYINILRMPIVAYIITGIYWALILGGLRSLFPYILGALNIQGTGAFYINSGYLDPHFRGLKSLAWIPNPGYRALRKLG